MCTTDVSTAISRSSCSMTAAVSPKSRSSGPRFWKLTAANSRSCSAGQRFPVQSEKTDLRMLQQGPEDRERNGTIGVVRVLRASGPRDADPEPPIITDARSPTRRACRIGAKVGNTCRDRRQGRSEYPRQAHQMDPVVEGRQRTIGFDDMVDAGQLRVHRFDFDDRLQQDPRTTFFQQRQEAQHLEDIAKTLLGTNQHRLSAEVLPRPNRLAIVRAHIRQRPGEPAEFELTPAIKKSPFGEERSGVTQMGIQIWPAWQPLLKHLDGLGLAPKLVQGDGYLVEQLQIGAGSCNRFGASQRLQRFSRTVLQQRSNAYQPMRLRTIWILLEDALRFGHASCRIADRNEAATQFDPRLETARIFGYHRLEGSDGTDCIACRFLERAHEVAPTQLRRLGENRSFDGGYRVVELPKRRIRRAKSRMKLRGPHSECLRAQIGVACLAAPTPRRQRLCPGQGELAIIGGKRERGIQCREGLRETRCARGRPPRGQ